MESNKKEYRMFDLVFGNLVTVNDVSEILALALPYVGQPVYCKSDGKYYKVTELGDKEYDGGTVKGCVVKAYSELSDAYGQDNQKAPTKLQVAEYSADATEFKTDDALPEGLTGKALAMQQAVASVDKVRAGLFSIVRPFNEDYVTKFKVKTYKGHTHTSFTFRTMVPATSLRTCDTVIDWGDGITTVFADIPTSGRRSIPLESLDPDTTGISSWCWSDWGDGEWLCQPLHRYARTDETYTVTIYGKDVWALGAADDSNVCEIFSQDLPVSRSLTNVSGFVGSSKVITSVNLSSPELLYQISNWSSCFHSCENLKTVTGFNRLDANAGNKHVSYLFRNCSNLRQCDFRLPRSIWGPNGYNGVFCNCRSLEENVNDLLPKKIDDTTVRMTETFMSCRKMPGVPDVSLFSGKAGVFKNAFRYTWAGKWLPKDLGGTGEYVTT